MSWEIYGPSSLRLRRTPPHVACVPPPLPPLEYRSRRASLLRSAAYQEIFRGLLHVLVFRRVIAAAPLAPCTNRRLAARTRVRPVRSGWGVVQMSNLRHERGVSAHFAVRRTPCG